MIDMEPCFIRRSKDPYGWMSNMSAFPVTYAGVTFRTTEALFQWLRFPSDRYDIRDAIAAHTNPMTAKMLAKGRTGDMNVTMLGINDLDNMRVCLKLKLTQHPDLVTALIETGDRLIVEDCSARQAGTGLFWGAAPDDSGGWTKGENWLGRLWTEQRNRLRA